MDAEVLCQIDRRRGRKKPSNLSRSRSVQVRVLNLSSSVVERLAQLSRRRGNGMFDG